MDELTTETGIIGRTEDGGEVHVDLDALIGSHALLIANSGGGKSGLVRRLLETTHGRVQQIILDGEDEFYTLREQYDYVIAGSEAGDVPAEVKNARDLAIGALTHGFSLICQLNDLGAGGAADFIGRFLHAMVNAPRALWHPVLVVVDEIQRFAPRQGSTEASEGINELLSRGRKRGFTAVMAGTKLTDVDPSVRGMVNNWVLGRVGQALDRNTMADALGFTPKEGRDRLRTIQPRHFWGFGPAISPEPILFRVSDVETTLLRPGDAKVPTPPAPEALREILAGLAPPPPEPEPEGGEDAPAGDHAQRDPQNDAEVAALREQVESLRGDAERAINLADEMKVQRDRIRAEALSAVIRIRTIADDLESECDEISPIIVPVGKTIEDKIEEATADVVRGAADQLSREMDNIRERLEKPISIGRRQTGLRVDPVQPAPAGMNPTAVAICDMLDRIAPAKVTWARAAAMTKRKARGGNFNTAKRQLKASGRIVEEGNFIRSSRSGARGMSRADAISIWRGTLTGKAVDIFEMLELATNPMTKDEIGDALGLATRGGNWNGIWAQLRNNDLIEEHEGGGFGLAAKLPGER